MPKESNPQFRRSASAFPNTFSDGNLPRVGRTLGVSGECAAGGDCRCMTLIDTEFAPTFLYIAERWPLLPPHVREAVLALIDAGQLKNSAEENRHGFS